MSQPINPHIPPNTPIEERLQCHLLTPFQADIIHDIMTTAFQYEPWTLSTIETTLSLGADGFFATLEDTPVGYIMCRSILGESEILSIAVAPTMQNQGIAQILLDKYAQTFRRGGGKSLFLEVAVDNTSAQNLYTKNGFHITGKRADYYQRPDGVFDAILMKKTL